MDGMKPRQFDLRDLFLSVTLLCVALACCCLATRGHQWTSFALVAPPALGVGIATPFHRKRAGLIWGALVALWLLPLLLPEIHRHPYF